MKRLAVLFIFLIATPIILNAQDLRFEEVEKVASNFLSRNSKSSEVNIYFNNYEQNDTVLLYMAHNKKEFILIANDLRVTPILGYSNEGSFNNEMPPQLIELIESYKIQILDVKRNKSKEKKIYDKEWNRYLKNDFDSQKASVAPIINVNWNQGSGWNRYCPEDESGPGGHVYVGCVAVGMAQAMSVFKHPDVGVGVSSYTSDYGTLTVNHGETEYNWDLMSSTSSDDYNSLLLYHCAVALEMGFGPDGSGAFTTDIAKCLRSRFDYSSDVYSAHSTEDDAWVELLKAELDEGRPICYGGNNGVDVGHSYNLDGYNSSNAFHVNWGYSGSYNGYFQVGSLNVNGSDYSKNAKAVLNIKPMDHSPYDIELSTTEVKEKLAVGQIAAIIDVLDPDEDDVHNIEVKGTNSILGEGYCPFFVDGDSLKMTEIVEYDNYEKIYIKITAQDQQGNEIGKEFTINILKDNYAPTNITISNDTIYEETENGDFVAKLATVDQDTDDSFTYSFEINSNSELSKDNGKFIISNDSLFTNFDFSTYSENECNIYVKSTDAKGESVSKELILTVKKSVNTSINDIFNEVKIYPNPVTNYLNISLEQGYKIIRVFDVVGNVKDFDQDQGNEARIDFTNYNSGLYFVNIELNNGQKQTFKVLKKD